MRRGSPRSHHGSLSGNPSYGDTKSQRQKHKSSNKVLTGSNAKDEGSKNTPSNHP